MTDWLLFAALPLTEVKTILKKLMETKEKVAATFSRGDACDTW